MSTERHASEESTSEQGPSDGSVPPAHIIGPDTSIEALGRYLVEKDVRNILVLIGAGVSVAAGIPDFRSPKTGLYAQLGKYNLSCPTDAFSIRLLRKNPTIFYAIAKEMDLWPGRYKPTAVHWFLRLLEMQGRLLRVCTQNIDGLEGEAQLSEERVVEAHGNFRHASCIDCHLSYDVERNRQEAMSGVVSHCPKCGGIVKPNVVFFGEQLPKRFFSVVVSEDLAAAECLIIIGTSLNVQPVASLPFKVAPNVLRILINAERVGGWAFRFPSDFETAGGEEEEEEQEEGVSCRSSRSSSSSSSDGYLQHINDQHGFPLLRDLFYKGDCQAIIQQLAESMGLKEELDSLMHGLWATNKRIVNGLLVYRGGGGGSKKKKRPNKYW